MPRYKLSPEERAAERERKENLGLSHMGFSPYLGISGWIFSDNQKSFQSSTDRQSLSPTILTVPLELNPTVQESFVEIATIFDQPFTSHCPQSLFPTAITVPSDLNPRVCE